MKYIVDYILNRIREQAPAPDDQIRVRLSGFEDVRIYEEVCRKLHSEYDPVLSVETRLAAEKWNAFSSSPASAQTSLNSMEANGWVAKDTSLTYYRNLPQSEAQLIVLMGTEAVKDQGGLTDCYYIDPERIKTDLGSDFHSLIACGYGSWTKEDAAVIDRLFHDLFACVPLNICLLSDRVDTWPAFPSLADFVELFLTRLPEWGLCVEGNRDAVSLKKLYKPKAENLFRQNWDFVTRKSFAKLTKKKYIDLLKSPAEYAADPDSKYGPHWEGWQNSIFQTYDNYTRVLCDYISGCNLEQSREQLLTVDIDAARDILNLKTTKKQGPKKLKTIKLKGAPLVVFTEAVLTALTSADPDERAFDSISIQLLSAEMADAVDPLLGENEQQQLLNGWRQICCHAGGVIDFIAANDLVFCGQEYAVRCSDPSFFSPSHAFEHIESGVVGFAAGAKKLDRVTFEILRMIDGNWNGYKFQFEWEFSLDEPWCAAFSELCGCWDSWMERQIHSLVPVITVDNYAALMSAKSEEEFLDAMEQSNFDFDCNLISLYQNRARAGGGKWYSAFLALGQSFIRFCESITTKGFYADLAQAARNASATAAFLDRYQQFGREIVCNPVSQGMEWVLDGFIHAFVIEENTNSVKTGELSTSCMIPPYHPAVLQKLFDQARFLLDGCLEWLRTQTECALWQRIHSVTDDYCRLSQIQEGVDIFPGQGKRYFGAAHGFANYCLCGTYRGSVQKWMRTILQKDAVFDETFSTTQYQQMNRNAQMLYDVIEDYASSLPAAADNLAIAVIDPDDLQPVIAAVHKHISQRRAKAADTASIRLVLHILVRPENKGGRNYLSYWADTFFSEDENVDVKIYQNIWKEPSELLSLLPSDLDMLFLMDVLKVDSLDFIRDAGSRTAPLSDCRFPIIYKPTPPTKGAVSRRIELTQRQFQAATIHSQVVYYRNSYEQQTYQKQIVVRKVGIDHTRQRMITDLHGHANWVICVDSGMDGALLRSHAQPAPQYGIIGYSTGKGSHGQYNLTITARASLIDAVQRKVEARLTRSFHWPSQMIKKAAKNCMEEAKRLDGIGLLHAVGGEQFSYKRVNEFLAYILTAYQERRRWEQSGAEGLNVLVRLDSYCHWFSREDKADSAEKSHRPDFLSIQAGVDENGRLKLDATVIECKIASIDQSEEHTGKAAEQAAYGVKELRARFDPASTSIRRRYWFAQLYRVLAFSQLTFQSDSADYDKMAPAMRDILDGAFSIHWSAKAMLYWHDWSEQCERVTVSEQEIPVEIHEIPQVLLQRLLLQDDSVAVQYEQLVPEGPSEREQEEWNEIVRKAEHPVARKAEAPKEERQEPVQPTESIAPPPVRQETDETPREPQSETRSDEPEAAQQSAAADAGGEPVQPRKKSLADVRVNIGKDRAGNGVFWEFGNRHLANRHLLITGTSGQGKTYSIQTMLKELSESGVSSAIFDYTEGFRKEQLEPEFRASLGEKIIEHIVYFEGIPIDPFRRQEIEISGHKGPEKISDVAQRIAAIFTHVYSFGPQQFSAIYQACLSGMQKYGSGMSFTVFREMLEESKNSAAKTVLSKMGPFFGSVEFRPEQSFDWNKVTQSDGTVTIFQLTQFVREIQVIITELMLWDAWHYFKKTGNKDTPFVVVLDEAQNLSMDSNSPAEVILREGRKFGWSAWFATQSLKPLNEAEIVNLHQAPFALYFKPTDDEIVKIAKQIDPASSGADWVSTLKSLHKGQCIVVGDRVRGDGRFGAVKPTVTNVTSFRERMNGTT